MITRLKERVLRLLGKSPDQEALPHIDIPTFAIGDIHGRFDLFEAMLARLEAEAQIMSQRPRLVLLGDYVDRGPQSKRVLERIWHLQNDVRFTRVWSDVVVLRGNHEAVLLNFLNDSAVGPVWADYGGLATLAAYDVPIPPQRSDPAAWEAAREAFAAQLPAHHLSLIQASELIFTAGDYLFVHAGVKPDQPLHSQGEDVFLWIRGEFMASPRANQHVVVHGHTPEAEIALRPWRIGLDSGAYATGVLSAVKLDGADRQIIQVM